MHLLLFVQFLSTHFFHPNNSSPLSVPTADPPTLSPAPAQPSSLAPLFRPICIRILFTGDVKVDPGGKGRTSGVPLPSAEKLDVPFSTAALLVVAPVLPPVAVCVACVAVVVVVVFFAAVEAKGMAVRTGVQSSS